MVKYKSMKSYFRLGLAKPKASPIFFALSSISLDSIISLKNKI